MNGVSPGLVRRMEGWSAAAGAAGAIIGAAGVAGWLFHLALLKSVVPGSAPIKLNSAVCLLLLGSALSIHARPQREALWEHLADALAILVALIAALTLFEPASGVN